MQKENEDILVYTVQVNYKSGISMKFETLKFEINGDLYEWNAASFPSPFKLGAENVESIWTVGVRTSTLSKLQDDQEKMKRSTKKP